MESASEIEWNGDAEERFTEKAVGLGQWGIDNGYPNIGKRFVEEVQDKIEELSRNVNLYEVRDDEERVAPLTKSKHVLVYKKEYYVDSSGQKKVRLVILDVRKFY